MINQTEELWSEVNRLRAATPGRTRPVTVSGLDPLTVTDDATQEQIADVLGLGVTPAVGEAGQLLILSGQAIFWSEGSGIPGLTAQAAEKFDGFDVAIRESMQEQQDALKAVDEATQSIMGEIEEEQLRAATEIEELRTLADDTTEAIAGAVASANGKNTRIYSTDPPGSTELHPTTGQALVVGDTWFKVGSGGQAGQVLERWRYTGSGAWQAETLSGDVLAFLDVAKLTVGVSAFMNQAVVTKIIGDAGHYGVLTAEKFAVLSQDGIYRDPNFTDAGLLKARGNANTLGAVYDSALGKGYLTGSQSLWLTDRGADEYVSVPITPGDRYTIRVYGTGLTAANEVYLQRIDSVGSRILTDATYTPDGIMWSGVLPNERTRLRLYNPRYRSITITRVEIRHGIGGVLIENGAINADKLTTNALDFKEGTGVKLTSATILSPLIKTAENGARVEINNAGLRAYNANNVLTADIGGARGSLVGYTITGGVVQTSANANEGIKLTSDGLYVYTSTANPFHLSMSGEMWAHRIFAHETGTSKKVDLIHGGVYFGGNYDVGLEGGDPNVLRMNYKGTSSLELRSASAVLKAGGNVGLRVTDLGVYFDNVPDSSWSTYRPLFLDSNGRLYRALNEPAMEKVWSFRGSMTFNGIASGTYTVSFPSGKFASTPAVTVSCTTAHTPAGIRVDNVSRSSCRVVIWFTSAVTLTAGFSVIAVQP